MKAEYLLIPILMVSCAETKKTDLSITPTAQKLSPAIIKKPECHSTFWWGCTGLSEPLDTQKSKS